MRAAVQAFQSGDPERARKQLRKALAVAPNNVDANHLMGIVALQSGRADTAVRYISKAIRLNPKLAQIHNNLGEAYRAQSLPEKAAGCYRKAIALEPNFVGGHNNLGVALLDLGRFDEAARCFERALELAPGTAIAITNLGRAHQARGDIAGAIACHRKAIGIDPENAAAHNNLANALQEDGNLDAAIASYRKALTINPASAMAHANLGVVLQNRGRVDEAEACFRRALELDPKDGEAMTNLAKLQQLKGDWGGAMSWFRKAVAIDPDDADRHTNLARLLLAVGQSEEAMARYDKALALDPNSSVTHANRGYAQLSLGDTDEAVASYRKALALDPENTEAYRALAKTRRFRTRDDEVRAMEDLWAGDDLTDEKRLHLGFALAKALEDLGEFEKSFEYVVAGNRLRRKLLYYSSSDTERFFADIKRVFSPDLFGELAAAGAGCSDATAIFIVGMPRSGTSLVEQILSSHSQVFGAGELQDLAYITDTWGLERFGAKFPECFAGRLADAFAEPGERYAKRLRTLAGGAPRVTDKLPYNFLRVGAIRAILPNAKIVHCRRDPLDTCLSVFKNYFMYGNDFSYDMAEVAHFYNLYEDLMATWRERLPGVVYDIDYEALVGDQEGETRKLLDYCGLDWEPGCVRFEKSERAVMTASAAQVRQPIYKDSVALWKRYEHQIAPLIDGLKRTGGKNKVGRDG